MSAQNPDNLGIGRNGRPQNMRDTMKANAKAIEALKSVIREPYAWPGGYPRYLVTDDCAALCHCCAKSNYRNILDSTRRSTHDGWQIEGADINWEDPALYCDHCGQQIESAYGED